MAQKIVDSAILVCDKGTAPSSLSVTSQDFLYTGEKLQATEQDRIASTNIKPFGVCKLQPILVGYKPCTPVPTVWHKTTLKDEINGYKLLTDQSECPCSIGGKISVQAKGHSENHETE